MRVIGGDSDNLTISMGHVVRGNTVSSLLYSRPSRRACQTSVFFFTRSCCAGVEQDRPAFPLARAERDPGPELPECSQHGECDPRRAEQGGWRGGAPWEPEVLPRHHCGEQRDCGEEGERELREERAVGRRGAHCDPQQHLCAGAMNGIVLGQKDYG
jgi:hypothetical protein